MQQTQAMAMLRGSRALFGIRRVLSTTSKAAALPREIAVEYCVS